MIKEDKKYVRHMCFRMNLNGKIFGCVLVVLNVFETKKQIENNDVPPIA